MTQPGTQKPAGQAHNPIFKPHRVATRGIRRSRPRLMGPGHRRRGPRGSVVVGARVSSPARVGRHCCSSEIRTRSSTTSPTRAWAVGPTSATRPGPGWCAASSTTSRPSPRSWSSGCIAAAVAAGQPRRRRRRPGWARQRCTGRTCARWRSICWCSSTSRWLAPRR
jgi:hypothetical protein